MKITPRYRAVPVVTYEGDPAAVAGPAVRQRLRLARTLAGLGPDQWRAPSRCAAWNNRDVVVHLSSTNRFWAHSIDQARRGTPTELLTGFDPVVAPARLVAAAGDPPPADVLDDYVASTQVLVDLIGRLSDDEWMMLAESPLGHVSVSAVVRHALWDAWVHERDILIGMGRTPTLEADEIEGALRNAAALGPAFGVLLGDLASPGERDLAATVATTDPAIGFTVTVTLDGVVVADGIDPAAPVAVHGPAVNVLEGLSRRTPLHLDPAERWLTAGLGRVFDAA